MSDQVEPDVSPVPERHRRRWTAAVGAVAAAGEEAMKQAIAAAVGRGGQVFQVRIPDGAGWAYPPGAGPVDPNTLPTPCSDAKKYLK